MAHADHRHTVRIAVFAVVEKDGNLLLAKRAKTGYKDGWYTLPSGHLEEGESVQEAAVRELKEEVGLDARVEDTEVMHVCHNKEELEYFNFFVRINEWRGEPFNAEPESCDEVSWYPKSALPENLLGYVREAMERIDRGELFSNYQR